MRILVVHNQYQYRGGEDKVFEAEQRLLRQMGHEVETLIFDNHSIPSWNLVKVGLDTVWSTTSARRVRNAIRVFQPHLMHVHNFFPLASPSIYFEAQEAGVRVVQTLHNFRLLCIAGNFYRNGAVCEDCLGRVIPVNGVVHGCYRSNLGASLASTAMLTVHRMLNTWQEQVDLFLVLGEFSRKKFVTGGLPEDRLVVKPNCLLDVPVEGRGSGGYLLFAGHLAEHKGIAMLLEAWRQVSCPAKRLVILGDGPMAAKVRDAVAADPSIEYRGQGTSEEVGDAMAEATALVFPSLAYETQGMSMVESIARGTPVIAFDIGGRSEIVQPDRTGWLAAADSRSLAAAITQVLSAPEEAAGLRASARQHFLEKFTSQHSIRTFEEIFQKLRIS